MAHVRIAIVVAVVVMLAGAACSAPVVINFDDRRGLSADAPGFVEGRSVAPEFLVHDQYLNLGVLFDSGGGGIAVCAPANAVSSPNTVVATGPGPVLSYSAPVTATFFIDGAPAVANMVRLDLTCGSSDSTLKAFDLNGLLLGQTSGGSGDTSSTLSLSFPGSIHSVTLEQGPFAFDNFTFDLVPEPTSLLAVLGSLTWLGTLAWRRKD